MVRSPGGGRLERLTLGKSAAVLLLNTQKACAILPVVGEWRSLVAHLHGVQGAAGSNPVSPTTKPR